MKEKAPHDASFACVGGEYVVMKSTRQNIENNISDKYQEPVHQANTPREVHSVPMQDDAPITASSGLKLMLERLAAYFLHRATHEERETIAFCLYHLFHHIDALYCDTLPALASLTHTRKDTASPSTTPPLTHTGFRYALWTRLQEMQQHIERIESLCHLLNRTAPRLLDVLDIPNEHQAHEDGRAMASGDTAFQVEDGDRWQQIYTLLASRLNLWQEQNEERPTFVSDATASHTAGEQTVHESAPRETGELPPTAMRGILPSPPRSLLMKIDATLILVLDSAGAMFGDIVPDFQVVTTGDDEVVATLLFDMMQQADLLLIQCDALLGPLQELIRHYTLHL